jgi:dolichyl-phosphate-mannose--protein O-mannosyl transferase
VLACELISRPYVNMGVADDWPYILSANLLAKTGHIVYNGWAAPILGWQLYVGAAMIKLFGFSFTSVRMGTLLVAMVMAFLLQRILVQANISDRNATLGTLALVLSPLYLMLSVTYMTDIYGLFAILVCLYGWQVRPGQRLAGYASPSRPTPSVAPRANSVGLASSLWFPPRCGSCAPDEALF